MLPLHLLPQTFIQSHAFTQPHIIVACAWMLLDLVTCTLRGPAICKRYKLCQTHVTGASIIAAALASLSCVTLRCIGAVCSASEISIMGLLLSCRVLFSSSVLSLHILHPFPLLSFILRPSSSFLLPSSHFFLLLPGSCYLWFSLLAASFFARPT